MPKILNYCILILVLSSTLASTCKNVDESSSVESESSTEHQKDEHQNIKEDKELELFKGMLAKKLTILTNYLKSSNDLQKY